VLSGRDVAALLTLEDCIEAVEAAFRAHAEGRTPPAGILGLRSPHGVFHVKAAGLLEPKVHAIKLNANFPANPEKLGLPRIQGVIVLFDGESGYPLSVMDSIEITALRTAAATAVAARRLAREDAKVATLVGCGVQGKVQLRALALVRRLKAVWAHDSDPAKAKTFAREMADLLGLEVRPAPNLRAATLESDVIITCTPSRRWLVGRDDVSPGAFIAAVGADHDDKQEIEPELLAAAAVVPDLVEQAVVIGDLHHAVELGLMKPSDVRAELGQVLAGKRPGRTSQQEIVVFDSTGTALQDVAAAVLVYQRALAARRGASVDLTGDH
jgi:alanine dehydrogenase